MASPEDPEVTQDATGASHQIWSASSAPSIEPPVYRPRRRVTLLFWTTFVVAAALAGVIVWLVLT